MTKVSVMYPSGDGKTFDMDYYRNKYLPMVGELLGDSLKGDTVEKGLGSVEPGSIPPFLAMGNMYFNSVEEFGNSFGPNAAKIMADLPNFTNAEPVIQISEVMS